MSTVAKAAICIYLMITEVELVFMCLFFLGRNSNPFSIVEFGVFLLLNFKSSLHILDINPY